MNCYICKNKIKKGDIVASISHPLKIISDESDYLLEQFYRHEQLAHLSCFSGCKNKLKAEDDECHFAGYVEIFISAVKNLGGFISKKEANEFLDNNDGSLEELIKKWFK